MDLFTHFVVPFAIMAALRRPMAERLAAGIGGWAPDFDTLLAWTRYVDERLYFLGHRGVSHSLLGAPLFALAVLALVCLPAWRRRWPKMAVWQFTLPTALIAMVASYTHVALDFLTIWGVPALYPWSPERFGLNWFFYSVSLSILVSGWIVWKLWRGIWKDAWTDRHLWRGMAVLAAVMAVSGALRVATHPDAPHGRDTQPGTWEWEWTTFARNETGWTIGWWSWGTLTGTRHYNETPPATPEGEAAVARARGTLAYRDFELYSWGPVALQAEPRGNGTWNVTFVDLTRRAQGDQAEGWFPRFAHYGMLRFEVTPAAVREIED